MITSDPEMCKLFVEALSADNYPSKCSYMYKAGGMTKIVCSLILLFDIVHIMKSIRNNWLNIKDFEKTLFIPN